VFHIFICYFSLRLAGRIRTWASRSVERESTECKGGLIQHIVKSGLWHSDRSYTAIDLMRVLAITAGIDEASTDNLAHYDTVGGACAGKVDISDATVIARKVAGLEANP